jgi:DNA-binding MarR family transcriptional regulator
MQQLRIETDQQKCAREILDKVPMVMRFIRAQVRECRASGISVPKFRTLVFIERTQNASLSAAAEHLGLSLPAMSRLVETLVTNALVERRPVATNRRQLALALTDQGRATLEKVRTQIRLHIAERVNNLTAADLTYVLEAMRVLHKAFETGAAAEKTSDTIH